MRLALPNSPTLLAVLVGLALLVGLVGPKSARAASCANLGASPDAPSDVDTAWATAIFEAVVAAEARVDPSATRPRLRIVAGSAEGGAGAWYCRSSDTVFVSRALVAYAALGRASDGADFLAFAIAHELAHRRFDGAHTASAQPLAAASCALDAEPGAGLGPGMEIEAAADHRAVFLLAMGFAPDGRRFRPLTLAHYRTLETFLTGERGLPHECPAVRARVAAIELALNRMARVRELYEAALAVAFQPGGVDDLAAIAAELAPQSRSTWDAVPELWVLRAHAHVADATQAGWCPADLAALNLPLCRATCAAIMPAHARIAPPDPGPRRSAVARAADLAAARMALFQARRAGLTTAELGGAEACLAFVERDPGRALAALATVPPHPATAAVRAANRRLFEQQRALLEAVDPTELVPLASEAEPTERTQSSTVPLQHLRALADRVAGLDCAVAGTCVRIAKTELAVLTDTSLAAWRAACEVSPPGVADDGQALFVARCPGWDASGVVGWTLVADGDLVSRATRVTRP